MSDFDKEAEREKLRQQYENERKERKSTQRMSELLLQGATMTGKHCDTCGDPIFRYDGNEFCSTCQQAASESAGENEETTANDSAVETTSQNVSEIEAESAEPDQPQQQSQPENQPPHPTPQRPPSQQPPTHRARRAPPSQASGNEVDERPRQPEPRTPGRTQATGEAGDLTEARNALVRKLTTLTREAESTNDVGYSRELLAATREAAEALAALDRANR
ncbi:Sjogren's syndrome/scleroderma autoantigen 1 family protein [Haladaptatus sp.]|uniref:Sjogren's syndrome/scleroderma autoantigen 1 family protein n=1 Tax=Haladaptatus sp. TaxID=1973141 RepID=UPI003C3D30BA